MIEISSSHIRVSGGDSVVFKIKRQSSCDKAEATHIGAMIPSLGRGKEKYKSSYKKGSERLLT